MTALGHYAAWAATAAFLLLAFGGLVAVLCEAAWRAGSWLVERTHR